MAVRVPLLNGSLVDVVFECSREVTVEEVNDLMEASASKGKCSAWCDCAVCRVEAGRVLTFGANFGWQAI